MTPIRFHRMHLYLMHGGRALEVGRWEMVAGPNADRFLDALKRAALELGGHRRLFDWLVDP